MVSIISTKSSWSAAAVLISARPWLSGESFLAIRPLVGLTRRGSTIGIGVRSVLLRLPALWAVAASVFLPVSVRWLELALPQQDSPLVRNSMRIAMPTHDRENVQFKRVDLKNLGRVHRRE